MADLPPMPNHVYQMPPPKAPALPAMGMRAAFLVSGWGKGEQRKIGTCVPFLNVVD